jgi:hypothetical protein
MGCRSVLSAVSGDVIWRQYCHHSVRPILVARTDSFLEVPDDGIVVIRRLVHCRPLWRLRVPGTVWNWPHADNERIVLASLDGTVTCLQWNGTIIGRRCFEQTFVASPIRWSNLLILVGNAGTIHACVPMTG